MATIVSQNKPQAHLGRTGHDLSSTHAFSMRPAVIRPVVYQDCAPDSAFRINCSDLVRTSALQTAAFLRGKHELDFFFVPYSQLFPYFNDLVFQRSDPHTVYQKSEVDDLNGQLPVIPLSWLVHNAHFAWFVQRFYVWLKSIIAPDDESSKNYFKFLINLLDWTYPVYSFQTDLPDGWERAFSELDSRSKKLVCLGVSYNNNDDPLINPDDLSFVGSDVLCLLDSAGYGSYVQVFESIFTHVTSSFSKDRYESYISGTHNYESLVSYIDSIVFNYCAGYFEWITRFAGRNASSVGWIPNVDNFAEFGNDPQKVNLLRLGAYHKVFYDRYRDSINDTENPNYLYGFDLSAIDGTTFEPFNVNQPFPLLTYLRPHCRMFKKDLAVSVYQSPQFGEISIGNETDDDSLGHYIPNTSDSVPYQLNLPMSDSGSSRLVDTALNIRFTLALQRYKETLLRAGNRVKDVLKAQFGVESRYIDDQYVRYLGSFSGALEMNKVSATAESGTYSVGDLAGNVFSSVSGEQIEFTCNDFGVIIGVMSFFPEVMLPAYGLNRFNQKSRPFDWYKPDFENLGLAPVSSKVFDIWSPSSAFKSNVVPFVYGYSARNFEYKYNDDQAHDGFVSHQLDFMMGPDDCNPLRVDWVSQSVDNVRMKDGYNTNYVVPRSISHLLSQIDSRNYMLPNVMDSLFVSLDSGLLESYHFDIILDCRISAVLPMSNLGLPNS